MEENKFETLENAWKQAIKDLNDEIINAVEIHYGHGTLTLQQVTVSDPDQSEHYGKWEITENG